MIGRAQLEQVEHDEEIQNRLHAQQREDEAAIRRFVDEMDNAYDRKDWLACRMCFTDQIDLDFTSLEGGEPGRISTPILIGDWQRTLFAEKKTFQQRSNHRIEIDGDRATVFSKAYAFILLETGAVTGFWEFWGNYTHELVRAGGAWKCSAMKIEVVHRRGDERVRTYTP